MSKLVRAVGFGGTWQQSTQQKVLLWSEALQRIVCHRANISLAADAQQSIRVCVASPGKQPKWDHLYSQRCRGGTQWATLLALKRKYKVTALVRLTHVAWMWK